MTEARKKQAKRKKVVEATRDRIENIEKKKKGNKKKVTTVDPKDVTLTVPYRMATTLNQNMNLRKSQNNIRKQLCVYVEEMFDTFVDDCRRITDPSIRARLYVEVVKMVIPRPKDFGDDGTGDDRRNIYKRLFGGNKDEM
ncbi:MAG: hypothetical protein LBV72_00630 [Tannerella sp.]|jgi:hypothetical protein|nr:hypothetical protein [Tannerella sp.]